MKKSVKILLIGLVSFFLGSGITYWICNNTKGIRLMNPEQWGSYSLGAKYADDLKKQGLLLNQEAFIQGINDATRGQLRLNRQQLSDYETQFREKMSKNMAEVAKSNEDISQEFMQQNSNRQGVKTTKSGLQYLVIQEGQGTPPSISDWVIVSYEMRLLDGQLIETSSAKGTPVDIPVKMGLVALEEGLQLMKPGSHFRIFAPPYLGYGKYPRPGIPANSVLIFDVKLQGLKSKK